MTSWLSRWAQPQVVRTRPKNIHIQKEIDWPLGEGWNFGQSKGIADLSSITIEYHPSICLEGHINDAAVWWPFDYHV